MRSVLASALLLRLREMTDQVNGTHLSDAEMYRILTSAVTSTWDFILVNGIGEYVKKKTFNTVANQKEYSLSTIVGMADDFYKLSSLYVDEGNGQLRPISRINPEEEQAYRAPASVVPMVLYYVPCAPVFTTGSESFDGINGWEEHTLNVAAEAVMKKKQDDAAPYTRTKRELESRIQTMANRMQGEPPRVVRKRHQKSQDRYALWLNNVSCWDIRGGNLELFYRYGYSI